MDNNEIYVKQVSNEAGQPYRSNIKERRMRDWDKNGEIDSRDRMLDYHVYENISKDSDHSSSTKRSSRNTNSSGNNSISILEVILLILGFLIIMTMLFSTG